MDETDDNDAVALSRQIFEIPTRVDARVALARIYYADGKAEQAKAFLQEGVFYTAGANDRLLKLAAAMIEIKALPEAIACLQNALRIDPEAGPAYALLAESWARLGEMQKAQGYAARAQAKGMSCDLSAYSDGPTPALARHLFDQYAANFESHLHSLDYRVPDYLDCRSWVRHRLDGNASAALRQFSGRRRSLAGYAGTGGGARQL
jgi:tetratricopeptide (TPR) repeat protein